MLVFNMIWESLRQKQETSDNNDAKTDETAHNKVVLKRIVWKHGNVVKLTVEALWGRENIFRSEVIWIVTKFS